MHTVQTAVYYCDIRHVMRDIIAGIVQLIRHKNI